ncbi:MAG: hypothetical protein ACLUD0_18615 [Eubacterium ramulus]
MERTGSQASEVPWETGESAAKACEENSSGKKTEARRQKGSRAGRKEACKQEERGGFQKELWRKPGFPGASVLGKRS